MNTENRDLSNALEEYRKSLVAMREVMSMYRARLIGGDANVKNNNAENAGGNESKGQ